MIYGDFTEFMVISRDLWWFHGIYGDFTGFMVIWWDINDLYSANNHQKKKTQDLEPVLLTLLRRPLEHWGCGSSHKWDVHP